MPAALEASSPSGSGMFWGNVLRCRRLLTRTRTVPLCRAPSGGPSPGEVEFSVFLFSMGNLLACSCWEFLCGEARAWT